MMIEILVFGAVAVFLVGLGGVIVLCRTDSPIPTLPSCHKYEQFPKRKDLMDMQATPLNEQEE